MKGQIAKFRPDRKAFMRRSLWVGGATLAVVLILGLVSGYWLFAAAAFVLFAVYTFLFDDPQRWRNVQDARWNMDQTNLSYFGNDGEGQVPLSEIKDVKTRFGWTVIVMLENGFRLEMPYVRAPKAIASEILAARDAAKSPPRADGKKRK